MEEVAYLEGSATGKQGICTPGWLVLAASLISHCLAPIRLQVQHTHQAQALSNVPHLISQVLLSRKFREALHADACSKLSQVHA